MNKEDKFSNDDQVEWPEQTHDKEGREIEDDGFVTVHGLNERSHTRGLHLSISGYIHPHLK